MGIIAGRDDPAEAVSFPAVAQTASGPTAEGAPVQSRRDQLQAYKFLTRRALAALVAGEPDLPEAPMRRLSLTTITGIMVAVLVVAGFAVFGLVRPGTNTKLSSGTIYIERETGAQFVIMGDGKLHPALNYTSAVLAIADSQGQVPVKTVAASTLARKPHGATIGIDGVPQSLPRSKSRLVGSPWTVCSQVVQKAVDTNVAEVTVTVGGQAGSTPLTSDAGVVVSAPGSHQNYLLWHGQRLQLGSSAADSASITTALNLRITQPVIVGNGLLNALPQGTSLATPSIPNAGQPGLSVGGSPSVVGRLIENTDNHSFEVVLDDGVAPVTPVQADLLETLPLVAGRPLSPIPARQATVLGLKASTSATEVLKQFDGLPVQAPQIPDTPTQAGGVCVVYRENAALALAVPSGTASANGAGVGASPTSDQGIADRVDIPAEKAALVVGDNDSATRFIIAAPGKKFAVSAAALGGLGYAPVTPLKLPAQWLLLLPSGPALDQSAVTPTGSGS